MRRLVPLVALFLTPAAPALGVQSAQSLLRVLPDYDTNTRGLDYGLIRSLDTSFNASLRPIDLVNDARHDGFTAFAHPAFPKSALRVKKHDDFCEKGTKAYTGYIDFAERHIFFYFFESRSSPATDDVLMLISGGPGCAGGGSAFAVMGPCLVQDPKGGDNATRPNHFSWNANTNFLFLDQPVGVGFSYSSIGETVISTEEASQENLAFIHLFFEVFSDFKGRPFHMTGGSYSGRSAPVFLSDILDFNNKKADAKDLSKVNVKTLSIGNGLTDYKTMLQAWYAKQCTKNSVDPVQTIANCVQMKAALPRCMEWFQAECIDRQDTIGCNAAWQFCYSSVADPITQTGRSFYDLNRECGTLDCYPQAAMVSEWNSLNSTRRRLGVDDAAPGFDYCHTQVALDYYSGFPDPIRPTTPYVSGLLERGVRVLIFAGVNDWACNDLGNEAWTSNLDWTGHDAFNAQPLRNWTVNGEVAGQTRSAHGLTWATVYGAGHMSSYDKPAQTLALMQRWLSEVDL